MMKKITILLLTCASIQLISLNNSVAQVTDMGGIDWTINNDTILGGKYHNIGKFVLNAGKTITVNSAIHFLEIEASEILIEGTIDANGKGYIGGSGGAGGSMANGSGVSGKGGWGGTNGDGLGGGLAGLAAGDGGTITQICGGLFCSGNRDGLNGGGGGAGGGSGGAYGAAGGTGGWGAYGTGFTGATGGTYGSGGVASSAHGNITDFDITYGSGGAGGGGGGGGWSNGTIGGSGGNGGGMISLFATDTITLTITARLYCNGLAGGNGGTGGGESDDNSYDCSVSGYSECGLCSESVYDGAGGAGGGAGGGSGGGIRIQSPGVLKLKPGALLQANGGNGGNKGYPSNTVGTCFDDAANGGGGSGGRIKVITTCNPNNEYDMSYQTYGGTGHQSGGGGSFTIIPVYPDNASPITGTDSLCAGTQTTYSIQPVNNAETYTWNLPTGASIISGAGTNEITVTWDNNSTSGLITVTPQNACGDGLVSTLDVIVKPLPQITLNPTGNTSICYGTSTLLTATADTSYTYQWQVDLNCDGTFADITSANSNEYQTPNLYEPICYRLLATNNCGTVLSDTISISLHTIPPTPVISYYDNSTLISDALIGNQWYNSQGIINGAVNQTYVIPQNDNYYVIVTDTNGCISAPSNVISFTVGIDLLNSERLTIYPNPSQGIINYVFNNKLNSPYQIKVTDALGKIVFEKQIFDNEGKINLSRLSSGVYTLNLTGNDVYFLRKIIIE